MHPLRRPIAALLLAGALAASGAGHAMAQDDPTSTTPTTTGGGAVPTPRSFILVVEAQGVIDPVTTDLVLRSLDEAEEAGAALFVLAVDSIGALDTDVSRLVQALVNARVPVVVWVGPGDGEARGAAVELLLAGHLAAASRGAAIGPATPTPLSRSSLSAPERAAVATRLEALARLRERGPEPARALATSSSLSGAEAEERGLVDLTAPTLRDLVASLDGRTVVVGGRNVELRLGEVVDTEEGEVQVLPIRFRQFGLGEQLVHALTSPFVAYLLLVLGLSLVVFEFFAVGIGLAAAAGALLVVGAFVGFSHLPVSGVGFALLVAGFAGLSVSVQAGRPGPWSVIGGGLLLAGSLSFYDGAGRLDPPWWQVVLVWAGALVFLLPGLAAVVRSRFSTPTIGRESMVGETGTARVALDPEGVVDVRGALWRARATRAAGIRDGDSVRVAAIEGLTLEVEPLEPVGDGNGGGGDDPAT